MGTGWMNGNGVRGSRKEIAVNGKEMEWNRAKGGGELSGVGSLLREWEKNEVETERGVEENGIGEEWEWRGVGVEGNGSVA